MFVFIEDRKEGMRETKEFSIKTRSWRRWHYTGSGSGSRAEVERARTMPIKQTLSVFSSFSLHLTRSRRLSKTLAFVVSVNRFYSLTESRRE